MIGDVTSEPFSRDEMTESVGEFLELYDTRPVHHNPGGMGLNHSWAVWFLTRKLQPDVVVESGVLRGHSTWLVEKAWPDAHIKCFDVSFKLLEYRSENADYFEGDLRAFDWSGTQLGPQSLCLLDDHQNAYRRIVDLNFLGMKRFIVEDNYPIGEGDFYSLQHMAAGVGFTSQQMSERTRATMKRAKLKKLEQSDQRIKEIGLDQARLVEPNTTDWTTLTSRAKTIETIPPIALEEVNRWGFLHEGRFSTPEPLGVSELPVDQNLHYNWITYVELHH